MLRLVAFLSPVGRLDQSLPFQGREARSVTGTGYSLRFKEKKMDEDVYKLSEGIDRLKQLAKEYAEKQDLMIKNNLHDQAEVYGLVRVGIIESLAVLLKI